jgi:hypothetical protein
LFYQVKSEGKDNETVGRSYYRGLHSVTFSVCVFGCFLMHFYTVLEENGCIKVFISMMMKTMEECSSSEAASPRLFKKFPSKLIYWVNQSLQFHNSPPFIETEISLSFSQPLRLWPYLTSIQFTDFYMTFYIHFNITLPHTFMSPKCSTSFSFSDYMEFSFPSRRKFSFSTSLFFIWRS